MRVRHKTHPTMICEVFDESKSYYVCMPSLPATEQFLGHRGPYALLKSIWEPVPEARWVDVTGECEFSNGKLRHGKIMLWNDFGQLIDGYRLRKVTLYDKKYDVMPMGAAYAQAFYIEVDAIVIEQQEQP